MFSISFTHPITINVIDPRVSDVLTLLSQLKTQQEKLMAGITDVNSAQTTLHADLVAQNGLIKQLLSAFASGTLTSAQAQDLVDKMNTDDTDAKANVAAITAAITPAPTPGP